MGFLVPIVVLLGLLDECFNGGLIALFIRKPIHCSIIKSSSPPLFKFSSSGPLFRSLPTPYLQIVAKEEAQFLAQTAIPLLLFALTVKIKLEMNLSSIDD